MLPGFETSKVLGYGTYSAPQDDFVSSKFLGYAALGAPQNDFVTTKFLGYVVLQPAPFNRFIQGWPNPIPRRRGISLRTWINPTPAFLIPGFETSKFLGYGTYAVPQDDFVTTKFLAFTALAAPLDTFVTTKFLGYAIIQPAPFDRFPKDWANPIPRRHPISNRTWINQTPILLPLPPPFFGSAMDTPQRRRRSMVGMQSQFFPGGTAVVRPVLFVVT